MAALGMLGHTPIIDLSKLMNSKQTACLKAQISKDSSSEASVT